MAKLLTVLAQGQRTFSHFRHFRKISISFWKFIVKKCFMLKIFSHNMAKFKSLFGLKNNGNCFFALWSNFRKNRCFNDVFRRTGVLSKILPYICLLWWASIRTIWGKYGQNLRFFISVRPSIRTIWEK